MTRRQLTMRRVEDTLAELGWDVALFRASYEALAPAQPEASGAAAAPAGTARISTREAAKRLRVDEKTVRRWVNRGTLQAWRSRSDSPYGGRYAFDDAQLAAFEREHWHLLGPQEQPAA